MDRDEIVCNCMGVTAGEIQDAIEGGASTVEQVQEVTGAGRSAEDVWRRFRRWWRSWLRNRYVLRKCARQTFIIGGVSAEGRMKVY